MGSGRWLLAVGTEEGRRAAVSGGMGGQPLFGSLFKLQGGLLSGPLLTLPPIRLADVPLTSRDHPFGEPPKP